MLYIYDETVVLCICFTQRSVHDKMLNTIAME